MASNTEADKAKPDRPPFKFTVDTKKLESPVAVLSGAQIKAMAEVDPTFGLFLERGHDPDKQIGDNEKVDLSHPGREHFFTAPPATFGSVA
jgi:hypothetical protein